MKRVRFSCLFILSTLLFSGSLSAAVQEQPAETAPQQGQQGSTTRSETADSTANTSESGNVSDTVTLDNTADSNKASDREEQEKKEAAAKYELKRFTLTLNPLSFAVLRFSANFEYMFIKQHAVIVVPSFWSIGAKDSRLLFAGAEAGYHFYSGERGTNGFFMGPSLIYMYGSAILENKNRIGEGSVHFVGIAVDAGGQHIWRNGVTLGGGAGLMYGRLTSNFDTEDGKLNIAGSLAGMLPRFLLTVGYSF